MLTRAARANLIGVGKVLVPMFDNFANDTSMATVLDSDRVRFQNSVLNGKNQMPPWKGVLGDEQIDQLWQYVRNNTYEK